MTTQRQGFGAPKKPWKTFGFGLFCLAVAAGVYFYLAYLEQQGANAEVNWLIAKLYAIGGKPMAAGFFGFIGLIAIGLGMAGIANKADDNAASRNLPPVAQHELTAMLMPALEFSNDDLAANQRGIASARQQAKLSTISRRGAMAGLIGGVIVLLAIGGVAAYFFLFAPTSKAMLDSIKADKTAALVLPIVLGVLLLVIVGSIARSLLRMRGVGKGRIEMVQGQVKLDATEMGLENRLLLKAIGQQSRVCTIKVGGQTFYVTEKVLGAFKHNAPYRIYYVKNPPAHMLLSAEALAAA